MTDVQGSTVMTIGMLMAFAFLLYLEMKKLRLFALGVLTGITMVPQTKIARGPQ